MPTQEEALRVEVVDSSPLVETLNNQVVYPKVSQQQMALADLIDGLISWRIWFMLAYQDIKLRYRRSVLGPFWLTLSMGITVYSMGYLYAHLFHVELGQYYPFLVAGMLSWSLISTMVIELTDGLIISDGLIKQIKLPYGVHIHRIVMRNILIFFHNMLVFVPIVIIYHESIKINFYSLLIVPGLLLIYLNAFNYGLILSMVGSRYRDLSQVVKSLVQVVFFVTPVMWKPDTLASHYQYIVDLNPFYAFIELIRAPLLGTYPSLNNLSLVSIMTVVGGFGCWKIFSRYRSRIVYWL